MSHAHISLRDVHVTGVNTTLRAASLKQLVLGKKEAIPHHAIPILRGVSLDIRDGDRVGIVGYNGSGKSSLLKVIAGIYPPQQGEVKVHGRVAPLIEMSLGFDREQSGRENIKLGLVYAGRIGEYSPELEEQIVAFTELGEHIDRPLKGYSSGMQARLCFAVSIFQHPDILLLDEAFATGDAAFVSKSRKAMIEKFHSVPIAILVSHDSSTIGKFCNRCIWIHEGKVRDEGNPEKILQDYEAFSQ